MKNLVNQIWTYVMVTIVTILVWLYAEDASIQEYTDQSLRLEFVLPDEVQGLLSQDGVSVVVDFNSSNGQYQQFLEKTRGEVISIQPFNLDKDISKVDLDIREQLEREVFRNLGINLTDVSPERIEVTFQKIVEYKLEVRLLPETGTIKLSAYEIPDPQDRIITIKLPAGQIESLKGKFATARIRIDDVVEKEKGVQHAFRVPIELPPGVPTQEGAADVNVLVTVANDRDTVNRDRLTIQLAYPPSINKRYLVEIDEASRFLTAFELQGPREQIELIKADPTTPLVRASVWLSNEEVDKAAAEGGELTKAVEIIAPPGVVPVSVPERVTIRVTPREAPATP